MAGQILGVNVRNRVATLWGIVPSTSVAQRAENCLRDLPGLIGVRSEVVIDPRTQSAGDRDAVPARRLQVPEARLQGALVHRAAEQAVTPGLEFRWRPAVRTRPGPVTAAAVNQGLARARITDHPATESLPGFPCSDSTGGAGWSAALTAPRRPEAAEEAAPVIPALVLPPPDADPAQPQPAALPASPQTTSSLVKSIEALRLADERFRGIAVEVRADVVYLRGTVSCWEHLFELARSLSRLPGVRRVLFEEVRAEAP